jgi:hypothetical protein
VAVRGVAERVEAMAREPLVAARIEFIFALAMVYNQLDRVGQL